MRSDFSLNIFKQYYYIDLIIVFHENAQRVEDD